MESTSELRRELETAIAGVRRRIDAAEVRTGSGFPVQAMWRDKSLAKLRRTLAELEEALSDLDVENP
jgi:hypothetical protein